MKMNNTVTQHEQKLNNLNGVARSLKRNGKQFKASFRKYWFLYLMILPGLITLAIYAYGPIIIQVVLAFTDYRFVDGVFGSRYVGFENFVTLFTEIPEVKRIIENTLIMSFWYFICGFFPSLILAIFLFDLRSNKFRKFSQTIVYIPHFFSWIIVYSIVYGLLSNTGIVNAIITHFGGERIEFLMEPDMIRPILIISSTWKRIGWGTIIYLAAMQSIDVNLYDAAKLDGCGPIRRIFAVTLPGIRHITYFLLIQALGGVLSGGDTEQILQFYNYSNISKADTIGTWVYRIGYNDIGMYSISAAMSFIQSTVGLIFVLISNHISIKKVGVGIW